MAGAYTLLNASFKCAAAITALRFVTPTAEETVKQADAAGQRAVGVAQHGATTDEATAGKAIPVMEEGTSWVVASGAITLNAMVSTTNVGKAKAAVSTEIPLGIARSAPAADNDLMLVELTPGLPALA
jgi:hypothetical protein